MRAACDFYVRKLGFSVAFLAGDPPFYGQVVRDGTRLNLRCVDRPVSDQQRRECEELLSAYVTVDDVDALYAEFTAAGVS
jgi:hypothetical protein